MAALLAHDQPVLALKAGEFLGLAYGMAAK